jgi:translation initiation factor RLI1
MAGKFARVDFNRCSPEKCDAAAGRCKAMEFCSHGLLEQEESFDTPMLLSVSMCVGCADCVRACPLNAIQIGRK